MNPRTLLLVGALTLAGVAGTADRADAQVSFGFGYNNPYYGGVNPAAFYAPTYGYGPVASPYYGGYGYGTPYHYGQSYYNTTPFGGSAYRSYYQAPSAYGPGGYRYQYRYWH